MVALNFLEHCQTLRRGLYGVAQEHRSLRCLHTVWFRHGVVTVAPGTLVSAEVSLRFLTVQVPRFHESACPPEVRAAAVLHVGAMVLLLRTDLPLLLV